MEKNTLEKALAEGKPIITRMHTRMDADPLVTKAYLTARGVVINGTLIESSGGTTNNVATMENDFLKKLSEKYLLVDIDVMKGELDHHGKSLKTSLHLALEKIGDERDWKLLKPVISRVLLIDSYGESLFADIGTIVKSLVHANLDDEEILEIGNEAAKMIIEFHLKEMERDQKLTKEIIKDFFIDGKEMPRAFRKYLSLLDNPRFERPTDICEIITAKKRLDGEKATREYGKKLISYLYQDFGEGYENGRNEAQKASRLRIENTGYFISVNKHCRQPQTHKILLAQGALAHIQQDLTSQIFFNSKILKEKAKEIGDIAVVYLRRLENLYQQRRMIIPREKLDAPGTLSECPEWHYFIGEKRKDGKQGIFIFNGSLTAPDVPKSKIPFEAIVSVIYLSIIECGEKAAT